MDGGGTDRGLTTDHKPEHSRERERIYRCGGTVERNEDGVVAGPCPTGWSRPSEKNNDEGKVGRVNGELVVSRGFGHKKHKETGGPGPEDRPVTADPEMASEEPFVLLGSAPASEKTHGRRSRVRK